MEKLKFLGIGGSTNIELGGNSCFIKQDSTLLIIDVCERATIKLVNSCTFENIKQIYIVITHTHADHVAGLGNLIWYLNFELNIKPSIIYGTKKYKKVIEQFLKITGVELDLVKFIRDKEFYLNDITLVRSITRSGSR